MKTVSTTHILNTRVIGLQGQNLGSADELIIDTDTGKVTHLVLSTAWQNVTIPWDALCFDSNKHAFTMLSQPPLRS